MVYSSTYKEYTHQRAAKYYGVSVGILIAFFVISHWSGVLFYRYGKRQKGTVMTRVSTYSRSMRSVMNRGVPGFNSTGHLTIFFVYIMLNVILTFTDMDWSVLKNLGKRTGWMSIVNLCLVIFLSLKNTPLSFLTHYTHNTLNVLHRFAGYSTVAFAMSHMLIYTTADARSNTLYKLGEWDIVAGWLAGFTMLFMALTAFALRRSHYELFYVLHILFFVFSIIIVGFHRPDLTDRVFIVVVLGAAMWGSDRLLRSSKMLVFSIGNFATLVPQENGGIRIFLEKAPKWAKAGEHAFLWIPSIRKFETHPFTIARVQDGGAEFVIAKQDGFTRDLYDFAIRNPGGSLRASVDGPYGYMPDFESVDKVILVAGGSGASYSAGVAVQLAKTGPANLDIEFIWALRDEAQLSWYFTELQDLKAASNVTMKLYCTKPMSISTTTSKEKLNESSSASISESSNYPSDQNSGIIPGAIPLSVLKPKADQQEIEKSQWTRTAAITRSSLTQGLEIKAGRPNIPHLLKKSIEQVGKEGRVMICACGPGGMMRDVQESVADVLRERGGNGACIEVHMEAFGW